MPRLSWGAIASRRLLLPVSPAALSALARHPRLWGTAWHQARALTASRWWARWPPLPGPGRGYADFRVEAMYGTPGARVDAEQLIDYLEWCRWMRTLTR